MRDNMHEKLFYEFAVVAESWCVVKYEYSLMLMSSFNNPVSRLRKLLLFRGTRKFFDI